MWLVRPSCVIELSRSRLHRLKDDDRLPTINEIFRSPDGSTYLLPAMVGAHLRDINLEIRPIPVADIAAKFRAKKHRILERFEGQKSTEVMSPYADWRGHHGDGPKSMDGLITLQMEGRVSGPPLFLAKTPSTSISLNAKQLTGW